MSMKYDVFISYARGDDEPFVKRLCSDLMEAGFSIWWDRISMPSRGLTFLREIQDAINISEHLILVVGPAAVKSDYVRAEWEYALSTCKVINPLLRLGNYDLLPPELSKYDTPDFRANTQYETKFSRLLAQLKEPIAPLGELFGVHNLPPHFLPRLNEIDSLTEMLLMDSHKPVVMTSAHQTAALQGMGGIGKSVLAAAFTRTCEARRNFPDGIIWLPFSQKSQSGDVLANIRNIGGIFGFNELGEISDLSSASIFLSHILSGKNCLLILDDIWKIEHVEPFINACADTRNRILITTRDGGLVKNLGAQQHSLGLLSDEQARQLLSRWAGLTVEELPLEANDVIKECGNLPLAIAMIGALVQHQPEGWKHVLVRLRNSDLNKIKGDFPNYDYPDLLRAIQVSVDALESRERKCYRSLAVFPEDIPIPKVALQIYWEKYGLDENDVHDVIDLLVKRSLVLLDKEGNPRLHDLQHDYVRSQNHNLPALHKRLLVAYALKVTNYSNKKIKLPHVKWGQLPNSHSYIWSHLIYHMIRAGQWNALYCCLTDFDFLEAKIQATSVYELESDYRTALHNWKGVSKAKAVLAVFEEWLRLESHHIAQAPELLFPSFYNHVSWLDAEVFPQHKNHIESVKKRKNWLRCAHNPQPEPPQWKASFQGHTAPCYAVALTRDDGQVITGSLDDTIRVWDLSSGTLLRTIKGHTNGVEALVVASTTGGEKIVSGSRDRTIKIWDLVSGRLLRSLEGHSGFVKAVAVTPNGEQVISGSTDKTIKVWDLASGKLLRSLEGHTKDVLAVAITPNGEQIISGSEDRTIKVWDLASGRLLLSLEGHAYWVNAIAVTPSGKQVISGSSNNVINIWDLGTGNLLRSLDGRSDSFLSEHVWVRTLAVTPDGKQVVSGYDNDPIKVWDLSTGKLVRTLEGESKGVDAVALTSDGKKIVSGTGDSVKVWNLTSGELLLTLEGHTHYVNTVTISPNGEQVISGSTDKTIKVWDLASGRLLRSLDGHTHGVNSVSLAKDGMHIVSGSEDGTIKVWNLYSGKLLRTIIARNGPPQPVMVVVVTPDGRQVVSGTITEPIKVWDMNSGRLLYTFERHIRSTHALAITPDGKQVVSGYGGHNGPGHNTISIWDLATGRLLRSLEGHAMGVYAVVVTPDGKQIVSGSHDKTIKIWDLASGRLLRSLEGQTGPVTALAVTPNGKQIVSGSLDNSVKIWDLESGFLEQSLEGHTQGVRAVAVTPNGEQIISGSPDKTIKVWNLFSHRPQRSLEGHNWPVTAIVLPPRGGQFVSCSMDHTIKTWNLFSGILQRNLDVYAKPPRSGVSMNSLAMTPDGEKFVVGSTDNIIRFYDLSSGRLLRSLEGHEFSVEAVTVTSTPDGEKVVSGSLDMTIKVWDLASGRLLRSLEGHTQGVKAIAVTPNGKQIISGSTDKTIKVWDLESGRLLRSLEGHTKGVLAVAITPNGEQIISGSEDRTIKVWNLLASEQVKTLEGHTGIVQVVAVTPDGRQVVSGSADHKIIVWDLKTEYRKVSFWNDCGISSLALSADDRWVIVGDQKGKVWIFERMK